VKEVLAQAHDIAERYDLFVSVRRFAAHQVVAIVVAGCAQQDHIEPELARPAIHRTQSEGWDASHLELLGGVNQLVPGRRDHGADLFKESRVVEHANPVQGQWQRVPVHVVGDGVVDDRLRELRAHVVGFPNVVNRLQASAVHDELDARARPITEGIRRVAASQLHQN